MSSFFLSAMEDEFMSYKLEQDTQGIPKERLYCKGPIDTTCGTPHDMVAPPASATFLSPSQIFRYVLFKYDASVHIYLSNV